VITNAAREGARVAALPDYTEADAQARVNAAYRRELPRRWHRDDDGRSGAGGRHRRQVHGHENGHRDLSARIRILGGIGSYFGSTFGTKTLTASSTMRTGSGG
jgi:hypothetical protein